jgi:transcriptional regulator with XRE-family HTH domain
VRLATDSPTRGRCLFFLTPGIFTTYAVICCSITATVITVNVNTMPRPPRVVKNKVSRAIVALRRRLGYSQQQFAGLFGVSVTTCARWELNFRPGPSALKALVELAMRLEADDLADVLYDEYEEQQGPKIWSPFAADMARGLDAAIMLIQDRHLKVAIGVLRGLQSKVQEEFPGPPIAVRIRKRETGESKNK